MNKTFFNIFSLFLCLCLQANIFSSKISSFSFVKGHLNKYASINQIHHDRLDDDAHVHTHKHTQDGEEHEHHHEHTKISSHEIQFFNSDKCVILVVFENTSLNYFEKESFFSSSYLSSLFRPPIS